MANFQEKVTFLWDLADLLRGPYKRNEYHKIILPFTVLKRFDCVLEVSKKEVLEVYNKYNLPATYEIARVIYAKNLERRRR